MNGLFGAWSKQAQVARAAYANLNILESIDNQIIALTDSGMSEAQAALFLGAEKVNGNFVLQMDVDKGFEILSDTFVQIPGNGANIDDGFSATFLRDRELNEVTLAIRGTQTDDFFEVLEDLAADDQIVSFGIALNQTVSLYNYYRRVIATAPDVNQLEVEVVFSEPIEGEYFEISPGSGTYIVLRQAASAGNINIPGVDENTIFNLAGHSLGGHLAAAFTRLFPNNVNQAYTYNAPGFDGFLNSSPTIDDRFFELFEAFDNNTTSPVFDEAKITTIKGEFGPSIIADLGTAPSPQQVIFAEVNSHGHNVNSDTLIIYELLERIDQTIAADEVNDVLTSASSTAAFSLESIVNSLSKIFLNDTSTVGQDDREALYERYGELAEHLDANNYQNLSVESINALDQGQIESQARVLIEYRYALRELQTFVILDGADVLYSSLNTDGSLDLENFSDDYLTDRSAFLELKVKTGISDDTSDLIPAVTDGRYIDQGTGFVILNSNNIQSQQNYFVFGSERSDELEGGELADKFYAGNGSDVVVSESAKYFIEGGEGNNIIDASEGGADATATEPNKIDAKSGRDSVVGGDGIDEITTGEGEDIIIGGKGDDTLKGGLGRDVYIHHAGDGNDTIEDEDGEGIIIFSSVALIGGYGTGDTYTGLDQLTTYNIVGANLEVSKDGETLTILNFTNGDFGIQLDEDEYILLSASTRNGSEQSDNEGILSDSTEQSGLGVLFNDVGGINLISGTVTGNGGDDRIYGGHDSDLLQGNLGNDIIEGNFGADRLFGGNAVTDFNQLLTEVTGTSPTDANLPGDFISGAGDSDLIVGDRSKDLLLGGIDRDFIAGVEGNDILFGDYQLTTTFDWDFIYDQSILQFTQLDGLFAIPGIPGLQEDYVASSFRIFNSLDLPSNSGSGLIAYTPEFDGGDAIFGGSGNDSAFGFGGNDALYGDALNDGDVGGSVFFDGTDVLFGSGGDDYLFGGGADDKLFGDGAFSFYGNFFETIVFDELGRDYIEGGDGNDFIDGGGLGDVIFGGDGNDRIWGDNSYVDIDLPEVSQGDDYIDGGEGRDRILGQGGDDIILGGSGEDPYLFGGKGKDTIYGGDDKDTILGGEDDDVLFGGDENNLFEGDTIFGHGGSDELIGGDGKDTLFGGYDITGKDPDGSSQVDGADILDGGRGNDILVGGEGNDTYIIREGFGLDTIQDDDANTIVFYGGANLDDLNINTATDSAGRLGYTLTFADGSGAAINLATAAGSSISFASGGSFTGNNLSQRAGGAAIFGTVGNDQGGNAITGNANPNRLEGLDGDDDILAAQGNDWIEGGAGNDAIFAGSGDDYIDGGQGDDALAGEQGNDNYVFNLGDGIDEVIDSDGIDTFRFGTGISPNDLIVFQNPTNDLVVQYGADQITVLGWFASPLNKVERFLFSDGTELDISQIEARLLQSDPPVVDNPIADLSIDEDATFSLQIPIDTFSDPNAGDVLTIQVSGSNGEELPAWLSYDESTQVFSGTPTNSDLGNLVIAVTAVDPLGFNVTDTFEITVNNTPDAPVINGFIPNQRTFDAELFELVIPQEFFTDDDAGDSFVLNIALADGSPLPAWLNYDAVTQTFSGTPAKTDVNAYAIEIKATDSFGLTSVAGFALNVQDRDTTLLDTLTKSQLTTDTGLQILSNTDHTVGGTFVDLISFGQEVTSVGDVNGDGFDDVFVSGGRFLDENQNFSGSAVIGYVVYGDSDFLSATQEVGELDGSNGYVVYDFTDVRNSPDNSFVIDDVQATVSHSDVNSDGIDDIFIRDKIILGRTDESRTELDLSQFDDLQTAEVVDTIASGNYEIISAGDINGDGINDAVFKNLNPVFSDGVAVEHLVVFGDANGIPINIDPATLNGLNGFRLITTNWQTYGINQSLRRDETQFDFADINGDGFTDILTNSVKVNLAGVESDSNGTIIFGSSIFDAEFNAGSNTDKTKSLRVEPSRAVDIGFLQIKSKLASLGDINADGFDDFSISTEGFADATVIYGGSDLTSTELFDASKGIDNLIQLPTSNTSSGFVLSGATFPPNLNSVVGFEIGSASFNVRAVGDINGDGYDDLIARVFEEIYELVSDPGSFPEEYVQLLDNPREILIYGSADSPTNPSSFFDSLIPIRDYYINGIRSGNEGFELTPNGNDPTKYFNFGAAGDFNGDGYGDLITNESNTAYVVYGDDFLKQVDFPGTPGADDVYVVGHNTTVFTGGGDDIVNVSAGTSGTINVNTGSGNDLITFSGSGAGSRLGGMTYNLNGGLGSDIYDLSELGQVINAGPNTTILINDLSTQFQNGLADTGPNILVFGTDVFGNSFTLYPGSLVLSAGEDYPTIKLNNFDPNNVLGGPRTIDLFQFADGTELTFEELVSQGFDIDGTEQSDNLTGTNLVDRINGFAGIDVLDGGQGNDTLNGGLGGDTYIYNLGDGIDTIIEEGGSDTLLLEGDLLQSDITALQSGLDLVISLPGTDQITVQNWFDLSQDHKIESIQFFDGAFLQRLSVTELFTNIPSNQAPVLSNAIIDQIAVDDSEFNFQIPSNAFNDLDASDVLSYEASLVDGSFLPSWLSFDENTQTFSGTPDDSDLGVLDIRITSTDTSSASIFDDFTLTINDFNDDPEIASAILNQSTDEDAAFSFVVPATAFSDVDAGDALTFSASQADGSALPAWLSFDALTQTFSGTPTNDEVGTLILQVTATDNAGASVSDNFDLTINNINDAPFLANAIVDQTATQDTAFAFTIPNDSFDDPDVGDALTLSATLSDGSSLPSWLLFDATTNTFGGTPTATDVGDITVRITATDVEGLAVFDDLIVTVNELTGNNPPTVVNPIVDQVVDEDAVFSFAVPVNSFDDIDVGDTLTYSAMQVDGSALPTWLSFDAATQTFSGTPLNDDVGTLSVRVTATDGSSASVFDDFDVTINNTNDAPVVANAIVDQSTDEDVTFNFTVPANIFDDIDVGDTFTYSATLSDSTALPTWLAFDAATQTFSGTPLNDDIGILTVRVTATDSSNESAFDDFDLIINNTNDAPTVANLIADQSADEDTAFNFAVPSNVFDDVDVGDTLLYSATLSDGTALPAWLAFDSATQTFNGTPANGDVGIVEVRVTATDTSNASVFDDFTLTVEAGNTLNLIEGNGQNNTLIGTPAADRILGKGGNDLLRGKEGNDELVGGNGSDDLFGNSGNDLLQGGNGSDFLDGGTGADILEGGDGRDFLYGWLGDDTLKGGAGNDDLYGEGGNDLLKGNGGNDYLDGGNGNDHLQGGAGFDDIYGWNGNDVLEGGAGVDFLYGENGNDTLNGGTGNDELRGGLGSDIYQLSRGDGDDLIREADTTNADIDQIQYGAGITTNDVWFDQNGNHLDVYTLGSDDKVQIRNWYNQPNRRIEEFTTQSGAVLNDEDVQTLVNAMAAFGAPVAGEVNLTPTEEQQIQTLIAATWQ